MGYFGCPREVRCIIESAQFETRINTSWARDISLTVRRHFAATTFPRRLFDQQGQLKPVYGVCQVNRTGREGIGYGRCRPAGCLRAVVRPSGPRGDGQRSGRPGSATGFLRHLPDVGDWCQWLVSVQCAFRVCRAGHIITGASRCQVAAPPRRVTSTDVARAVGLSRTTVSYVLNNTPNQKIPEITRRRVLDAAPARICTVRRRSSLRSGRSDVVLCLLPDWPIGVVIGRLLESMAMEFGRAGTYHADPSGQRGALGAQGARGGDPGRRGVLRVFALEEEAVLRAAAVPVALVLTDRRGRNRRSRPRSAPGGRTQVEHLVGAGHHTLGYASFDDPRLVDFIGPRLDGVRKACAELGLAEPIIRVVAMDVEGAAAAVADWVKRGRGSPRSVPITTRLRSQCWPGCASWSRAPDDSRSSGWTTSLPPPSRIRR